MSNGIGDSLSDLAPSEGREDGADEDDDEEDSDPGKLSEDDNPVWVMGTITKTVQHSMGSFWQKQIWLYELTKPGWRDAANYFRKRDTKYGMAKLGVPAGIKPQTHQVVVAPAPTTLGELIDCDDTVPGR